jgi:hypothetical protein
LFAEIPVVVSLFSSLDDIELTVQQVFLVLDLNGMAFFSHARRWTEADSALCNLTDVWNEVRFIDV